MTLAIIFPARPKRHWITTQVLASLAGATAAGVGAASVLAFGFLTALAPATPLEATVKLISDVSNNSHGTAFHVGNGVFITANHVVAGEATLVAQLENGENRPATVLWSSTAYDVAAVSIDPAGIGELDLDCRDPVIGEQLRIPGSPFGVDFFTTFASVATLPRIEPGQPNAEAVVSFGVSGSLIPGMSGGPVIDTDGEVIGMTRSTLGTQGGPIPVGWAVPSTVVCYLLGRGPAPEVSL